MFSVTIWPLSHEKILLFLLSLLVFYWLSIISRPISWRQGLAPPFPKWTQTLKWDCNRKWNTVWFRSSCAKSSCDPQQNVSGTAALWSRFICQSLEIVQTLDQTQVCFCFSPLRQKPSVSWRASQWFNSIQFTCKRSLCRDTLTVKALNRTVLRAELQATAVTPAPHRLQSHLIMNSKSSSTKEDSHVLLSHFFIWTSSLWSSPTPGPGAKPGPLLVIIGPKRASHYYYRIWECVQMGLNVV